ncbi:MAG: prepilin peptidase [Clostridiales Family XIII bacterium]|jgi:Flp pilus assembly protein protease CpaA|nr:prepilin peptidase [Clostridiales Family XIII bacterium]
MALCVSAFVVISFAIAWIAAKAYADRRVRAALAALIAAGGGAAAYAAFAGAYDGIAIASLLASYLALSTAVVYDLRLKLIPNAVPLALAAVRAVLLVLAFFVTSDGIAHLLGAAGGFAVAFALLAISAKLSKGGVGAGDVKLLSALGFACGFAFVLSALILALLLCALTGIALLLLRKAGRKDSLPFAPFVWGGFEILMIFSAI